MTDTVTQPKTLSTSTSIAWIMQVLRAHAEGRAAVGIADDGPYALPRTPMYESFCPLRWANMKWADWCQGATVGRVSACTAIHSSCSCAVKQNIWQCKEVASESKPSMNLLLAGAGADALHRHATRAHHLQPQSCDARAAQRAVLRHGNHVASIREASM